MALGKAYVGVPQHSVKFFQVMQARLPNVSGNFALIAGESRRTSQSFPESPTEPESLPGSRPFSLKLSVRTEAYTVNGETEHAVAERRPKYSLPYEKFDITA